MRKMHYSFVKDLRNYDFSDLFSQFTVRLERQVLKEGALKTFAERIAFHKQELILLKHARPGHELTRVINKKIHTRKEYLISLRTIINGNLLSYLPKKREAASRLELWLEAYKKDLYKPSISGPNTLVTSMIKDRKEQTDIKEAITLLELDGLLDAIYDISEEIFFDASKRSKEVTLRKSLVEGLREAAYQDLKRFIHAIDLSYVMAINDGDEEEAESLLRLGNNISDNLMKMRSKQRARSTKVKNKKERNKRMKNIEEGEENTDNNSQTIESSETKQADNLPVVIYDVLPKINEHTTPKLNNYECSKTSTNLAQNIDKKAGNKISTKTNKPITNNVLNTVSKEIKK